ncbi:MAG: MBOAT family O-acyltransferase [Planctomycetota bacterium]|jgi:D-alanyl-lipoteichoic acid acyltransferase DltB (MBOAT superfamily)
MLFNSTSFAAFFVMVFASYWLLRRSYKAQNLLLLVASYFFYGWWDVRFLVLIALSTVVDYFCALSINNGRITARQRLRASVFLIFVVISFLGLQWSAIKVVFSGWHPSIIIDWRQFVTANSQYLWMLLGVLLAIVLFNVVYPFLNLLRSEHRRKFFLVFSVFANLTILGVFKYYNFFADNFTALAQTLFDITPSARAINIILPVGISFYTFQTMSYTIDVYRRKTKATHSLLEVATYVSFFPQLVAGPIERGKNLLPQFQKPRVINMVDLREGLWLIVWGLFKKMVVADNMARIVNETFGPFDNLSSIAVVPEDGVRLLVAIYAFAIQIYCDFSGYSDIARGTARLLGFDIMVNFRLPYFAKHPSDFWRRWHISLSTWLRDYLYIPLGGNRSGNYRLYRNLMITMLLGGLWHGAAWTFVLWGGFHGIILILYRVLGSNSDEVRSRCWVSVLQGVLTFHIVCFGWLIFRAQNLTTIGIFLQSIFLHPHWSPEAIACLKSLVFYSWFLVLFQIVQASRKTLNPMAHFSGFIRLNVWIIVIMSLLSIASKDGQEFIYFAF